MSPDQCESFDSAFLDGPAGRLFVVYCLPRAAHTHDVALVFVAPFAEEMNYARRTVALQARELARVGIGVLVLDLYGCGDSAGDFREARWEIWREDIVAAADWLRMRGVRAVGLWGLRLGGLLAAEVAANQLGQFDRLVLWQPVLDGATMLTQFLRIRIAAGMSSQYRRETIDGLRAVLASGRAVEVCGYDLSPELVAAIEAVRLDGLNLPPGLPIDWLELVPERGRPVTQGSRRVIERWQAIGHRVDVGTVVGPPIWAPHEARFASQWLDATAELRKGQAA